MGEPRVAERLIFREQRNRSSRGLWIGITPSGEFEIVGQDLGDEVEDLLGAREYEFSVRVPATEKDALLLALVEAQFGARSSGVDDMRAWLEVKAIRHSFATRRGE